MKPTIEELRGAAKRLQGFHQHLVWCQGIWGSDWIPGILPQQGSQTLLLTYTERGQQRRNTLSGAGNSRTIGTRWKKRDLKQKNIEHGRDTVYSATLFLTKCPYILVICFAKCVVEETYTTRIVLIGSTFFQSRKSDRSNRMRAVCVHVQELVQGTGL